MRDPCGDCGETKFWQDGRCSACAKKRKKNRATAADAASKRIHKARKLMELNPTQKNIEIYEAALRGVVRKNSPIQRVKKEKKLKGSPKEKGFCSKCDNKTLWDGAGNCDVCMKKRRRERYEKKRTDPVLWEEHRRKTKEARLKRKEFEIDPQERTEAARKGAKVRQKRIKEATPSWLTKEQKVDIQAAYFKARHLSVGETYHVDHIIPLAHPLVCGLHVPWNLRVISEEENLARSAGKYEDLNEFL